MRKPLASEQGVSTLVRAKFGPGMLLQHEDLEQLNAYTRDLSRLLFRSFFGCGVVCGLTVTTEEPCGKLIITVASGLALDCNGDPIYLPKDQRFPVFGQDCEEIEGPLWVVLCGTTRCCTPRTAVCSSDDDEPSSPCTRERYGYEIRVARDEPDCVCRCTKPQGTAVESACWCVKPDSECYKNHYDGQCGCSCDDHGDCECECVLLARLEKANPEQPWKTDYTVRRFIRPVLMRDPRQFEKKEQENHHDPVPENVPTETPRHNVPLPQAPDNPHEERATTEPRAAEARQPTDETEPTPVEDESRTRPTNKPLAHAKTASTTARKKKSSR